jgi:aldose 1-epimerase
VSLVTLRNASLLAEVMPGVGGSLARFDWIGDGVPRAVFRPCAMPPLSHSQVACFAMLPWANRIAPDGFEFDGRPVRPPPNRDGEPCPIHGEGWQAAWDVDYQSATDVCLTLDRRGGAPFSYVAELQYRLLDTALQITLELRNCGAHALPFGMGLHPWFVRGAGARLRAGASHAWTRDALGLPLEPVPLPAGWDFSTLSPLPHDAVDHVFSGWNGQARICLPEQGVELGIGSDMEHFILYSPAGANFFCFEPVDHVPNRQAGASGLAPGSSLRRTIAFAVAPL